MARRRCPGRSSAEFDHENTTGVAVDSVDGSVYLDNRIECRGVTPSGLLIQRFGEGR